MQGLGNGVVEADDIIRELFQFAQELGRNSDDGEFMKDVSGGKREGGGWGLTVGRDNPKDTALELAPELYQRRSRGQGHRLHSTTCPANLFVAFKVQVGRLEKVGLPPLLVAAEILTGNRDIGQGVPTENIPEEEHGKEGSESGQEERKPGADGL